MNIDKEWEALFEDWLIREMPPGTVIGDPKWWAPRILRAALGGTFVNEGTKICEGGATLDEQKAGPSDEDLLDEFIVRAGYHSLKPEEVISYARALLSRYGAAMVGEGKPVGVASAMPGTSGFTMACFKAIDVPAGTEVYATPKPTDEEIRNQALEALKNARQFIINGIDLGFILMPDPNTPDSAHDTLPEIEAAIRALKSNPAEVKG